MNITKKMADKKRFSLPFYYFPRGRDAFEYALRRKGSRGRTVLLPGYIGYGAAEGSGVFDPVRNSGRPHDFYRMKGRLEIDVKDAKRAIARHPRSILLLIHYFGFKDRSVASLKRFAADHDCLIVEDFAHGLFTFFAEPVVDFDYGIFSLHKMLPYPNRVGGMLLSRERLDIAREFQGFYRFNLSAIAEQRRANYCAALERLKKRAPSGLTILRPELGDAVPESFPILLANRDVRNRVHARMNAEGFGLISLYHELIAPIDGTYRTERRISDQITNLPIHQDANESEVRAMVDCLCRVLREIE